MTEGAGPRPPSPGDVGSEPGSTTDAGDGNERHLEEPSLQLCAQIDGRVTVSLTRHIEGEWPYLSGSTPPISRRARAAA
jgi:hypothetical protein